MEDVSWFDLGREVMDYVQGKIPEPPLNAPATTKTKYNKAGVKAKKIFPLTSIW